MLSSTAIVDTPLRQVCRQAGSPLRRSGYCFMYASSRRRFGSEGTPFETPRQDNITPRGSAHQSRVTPRLFRHKHS